MKTVYILSTGGTIEKRYEEASGRLVNLAPKLQEFLKNLRLHNTNVRVQSLMNKDSLDLTEADLLLLLSRVAALASEGFPIVITHGTDTMTHTATFLQQSLVTVGVPVVLTGAIVPLGFERSDGMQNITESLIVLRFLNPGFYIVMHGECHCAGAVKKDVVNSRFISNV
jgi:L-asparaginase